MNTNTTKRKARNCANSAGLTSTNPFKEIDMDNTTDTHRQAATAPCEEIMVQIPCDRAGCDEEGKHHEEFFDRHEEQQTVLHTIRIGYWVDVCASDDQPWSMFIEAREVMGTLEMEAIANDVRRAANLATDLNAPIIDQWQRVGNHWMPA